MLRRSSKIPVALVAAALLATTPAVAQGGLAGQLADAGKQLDADVQACKPISLGEYQSLLYEAAKNKQRAEKMAKKGMPADMKQVDADLAAASALLNKAMSALVGQCLRAAQRAQPPQQTSTNLSPFARDMLAAHNAARAVVGSPPLRWNHDIANAEQAWAEVLAERGTLEHRPRDGRGNVRENLAQAPLSLSPIAIFNRWVAERANFVPGIFPNVCTTGGDCSTVWHVTQIFWFDTTELGCGKANSRGYTIMACGYAPGGNKDGKPVLGQNLAIASRSPGPGARIQACEGPPVDANGAIPINTAMCGEDVAGADVDTKVEQPQLPGAEVFKPGQPAAATTATNPAAEYRQKYFAWVMDAAQGDPYERTLSSLAAGWVMFSQGETECNDAMKIAGEAQVRAALGALKQIKAQILPEVGQYSGIDVEELDTKIEDTESLLHHYNPQSTNVAPTDPSANEGAIGQPELPTKEVFDPNASKKAQCEIM